MHKYVCVCTYLSHLSLARGVFLPRSFSPSRMRSLPLSLFLSVKERDRARESERARARAKEREGEGEGEGEGETLQSTRGTRPQTRRDPYMRASRGAHEPTFGTLVLPKTVSQCLQKQGVKTAPAWSPPERVAEKTRTKERKKEKM